MKQFNGIDVLAPGLFPEQEFDEAKVLGQLTWLWYQHPLRGKVPLDMVMLHVLPAIKAKRFVHYSLKNQSIAFMLYAKFSSSAESQYCYGNLEFMINPDAWSSGDRLWIISRKAPKGHHYKLYKLTKDFLFPNGIIRALKAKRNSDELRLLPLRGVNVSREQQLKWEATHPILPYQPNTNPNIQTMIS